MITKSLPRRLINWNFFEQSFERTPAELISRQEYGQGGHVHAAKRRVKGPEGVTRSWVIPTVSYFSWKTDARCMEQQKERQQQRPSNEIIVSRLPHFYFPLDFSTLILKFFFSKTKLDFHFTREYSRHNDEIFHTRVFIPFTFSWCLSCLETVSFGIRDRVDDIFRIFGLYLPWISFRSLSSVFIRGKMVLTK